jgi:two-component system response regulator AgrA
LKKIIICEDNLVHINKIKCIVKDIIAKKNYNFKIALVTQNIYDVIEFSNLNRNEKSIYLIDIDLKSDINGIRLAEIIRKNDIYANIIFITNHIELSFLSFKYKVQAIDFIAKDNFNSIKKNLQDCLEYINETFYKNENINENYLLVKCNDIIINVVFNDILFIESSTKNSHKLILHEKNRLIEFSDTLKEVYQKLNEDFYRCHKAYIVNVCKIREVNKKERVITFENGEICYASFRLIKGLLKHRSMRNF